MALLDSIALAAADQIRRTAGARAGVIAYRNLLQSGTEETRARAVLAGIACAIDATDEHAAFSFAEAWFPVSRGSWEREVVATVRRLHKKGFGRAALLLAETEHRRKGGPFIAYVHARICEARGQYGDALSAFASCASFDKDEGAKALVAIAKLQIARARARSPETREEALALARTIDAARLAPRQRMQHARICLLSASRFERATALSTLADVARAEPSLQSEAVRHAALHADRMGARLTALEADRVRAALLAWPSERQRAVALARLDGVLRVGKSEADDEARLASDPDTSGLFIRARAVLQGGIGPPATESVHSAPNGRASDLALSALAQARKGTLRPSHVADVTRALEPRIGAPPCAFTLALVALSATNDSVHPEAAELAAAVIERGVPSPRGFSPLADVLSARGRDDVAERALRLAEATGEAGAAAKLTGLLARRGRMMARTGKRREARSLLMEARRRAKNP